METSFIIDRLPAYLGNRASIAIALAQLGSPDGRNRNPSSKPARDVIMGDVMSDAFPDRLSINPKSPHYDEEILKRSVGIRFNGTEKTNVEEYCISEGWIRVAMGKSVDRHGHPLLMKLNGTVEPFFRDIHEH